MIFRLLPASLLCALFVVGCILLALAGLALFRRSWRSEDLPKNREVSGLIFGTLSAIYSLILAFVIVAVWGDYEELRQTVDQESDKLYSISIHAATLPDSLRQPVQQAVRNYCRMVVEQEWKMTGQEAPHSRHQLTPLRQQLAGVDPSSGIQSKTIDIIDDNLNDIIDLHTERLSHARSHVPRLVWLVLIAGSMMVVYFSWFLRTESRRLQAVFTAFLTAMIAMCLFLLFALDHPFEGSTQISNKPYVELSRGTGLP